MKQILFILLFLLTMNPLQAQQDTLFYIGDPMCSWCYGFSPELDKIKADLPETVQFQLIMGGLRPNGTQRMSELEDFLRKHWEEIGELTGQAFQYEILLQSDFIYNTEPSCRAVIVARQLAPKLELDFFKAVQTAFYAQNKDIHELQTYLDICTDLEIDGQQFATLFESDEFRQLALLDFQISSSMGVRGFPSLVFKKGDQLHLLSNGYQRSEIVLEKVEALNSF